LTAYVLAILFFLHFRKHTTTSILYMSSTIELPNTPRTPNFQRITAEINVTFQYPLLNITIFYELANFFNKPLDNLNIHVFSIQQNHIIDITLLPIGEVGTTLHFETSTISPTPDNIIQLIYQTLNPTNTFTQPGQFNFIKSTTLK